MPTNLTLAVDVLDASRRIESAVRRTMLMHSPHYSELTGANVWFKCENLQYSGSFKLRGAMNKFLSLSPDEQSRGLVAASTGNHGKAVACTAQKFGGTATIFAPLNADPGKMDAIRKLGSKVCLAGSDCVEAEAEARAFSEQHSANYVSPYNDPQVVAGQGTIGLEVCQQLDQVDAVVASLGGGGLISGVAGYIKSRQPDCQIIACSPVNSNVMIQSLAAGKLLDLASTETLSDGTAGGIERDSITFGLCQQMVDHCVSVSESDIAKSLIHFTETHGMLIEGAAAVAIAGLLEHCPLPKGNNRLNGKNVVVILCGANISLHRLVATCNEYGYDSHH